MATDYRRPARTLGRWRARAFVGLALLFNLPFVLLRVQRGAFDTDTHLFFASHYQARWWDLWEPRWYLGFSVASYPPLVHQLIALLGWPLAELIRFFAPGPEPYPGAFQWFGLEAGFVLVLVSALALFPLAVRDFARLFVGPAAADAAGLCAVVLPALLLAAWAFGQLPTVVATVALLAAITRGADFVRRGRRLALIQAVLLAGVAAALHHGVFLFAPAAGGAALLAAAGRGRWRLTLGRGALWVGLSALSVAGMLWPFLQWSQGQDLQTPIDHASRHNFLTDPLASLIFFWPVYGPLLLVIPLAVKLGRRVRRTPLLLAAAGLAVLGLGGTTPLPRLLFGAGWAWLTYDRFAFWAALLLLPFVGAGLILGRRRRVTRVWLAALIGAGYLAGAWSQLAHAQPPPIDPAPLVAFLNQPAQQPYRYLTLGFGDQFAQLSTLTANGSPDGNYHTARALPELRASGLGSLDTAVWNPAGVEALAPLLARAPADGLRWALVNHPAYAPVLRAAGWQFRFMVGSVAAWEQPAAPPAVRVEPAGLDHSPAALWWGGAPLSGLVLALAALSRGRGRVTRAGAVRALAGLRLGLWAATLGFSLLWWFHPAALGQRPGIYFTYQSGLIFAGDVTLALSLLAWAGERVLRGEPLRWGPHGVAGSGLVLWVIIALSALGAEAPALTLAFTAQTALLAGLYLALINDPPAPAALGAVSGAAVFLLALVAVDQALAQHTQALNLPWPGALAAADRGASVVQNAAGARWLRAYATLPHPNILAGVLLALLTPVLERYLTTGRRVWLGLAGLGWLAEWLTFSRAGWLGAGALLAVLGWRAERRRWGALLATALLPLAVLVGLLGPFFWARTPLGAAPPLEQRSVDERLGLARASLTIIAQHPGLGVGAGNFVLALARLGPAGLPREPVHNLWLLIAAETGAPGLAAALALTVTAGGALWRRRAASPWPAAMLGLGVVALFDHFWWSLPPARLLLIAALAVSLAPAPKEDRSP